MKNAHCAFLAAHASGRWWYVPDSDSALQNKTSSVVPTMPAPREAGSPWLSALEWLVPLLAAWCFYATLSHEASRRIAALDTVENYAFAVFNQLLYNFSHSGHFQQTIHRGYDNSWMWSGHKAAVLPLVGYLYGLKPSPLWLAQIQIGMVALGAFPAYALGRLCVGGLVGGLVGLLFYFGYPPLYYIALNDYQDVILAIPLLMLTLYQSRRGSVPGFILAALLTCAAREELGLIVALVGFGVTGGLRRRVRFGLIGALTGAVYLGVLYVAFHHQMRFVAPAQSQLTELLTGAGLPRLEYDKAEAARFYLGFLRPMQWLALGSPLTLLPGGGILAVHVLVNPGNGVDRLWTQHAHIHHLAPLIPLFVAASLETLGYLLRWARTRFRRLPAASPVLLCLLIVVVGPALLRAGRDLQLEPTLSLRPRPHPTDPVWRLVRAMPPTAVVATDVRASLAVAARPESYTYDESLSEKLPGGNPLAQLDYLLVNRQHPDWLARGRAWPGVTLVDETPDYVLLKLR